MAGLGLAGLGQGMLNARNANTQRMQVQLESQRLGMLDRQQKDAAQAKLMDEARKSIADLQATFDKTARAIVARGGPEALQSPQAQQQLAIIMQPAMQTGVMAGLDPRVLAQQFAATLEGAKTEPTADQKMGDVRMEAQARAEGTAAGTPQKADLRTVEGVGMVDFTDPNKPRVVMRSVTPSDADKPKGPYTAVDKNGRAVPAMLTPKGFVSVEGRPLPESDYRFFSMPSIQGTPEQSGITTSTNTEIDKRLLDTGEQIGALEKAISTFDPKVFTVPGKTERYTLEQVSKFGGKLSPENQKKLEQMTASRQDISANFIATLHKFAGATMTPTEVENITKTVANVENDSPVAAMTKLKNGMEQAKLSQARLIYFKEHGIPANLSGPDAVAPIGLDQVKGLVMADAEQRKNELVQQGLDPQTAAKQAVAEVKSKYKL